MVRDKNDKIDVEKVLERLTYWNEGYWDDIVFVIHVTQTVTKGNWGY